MNNRPIAMDPQPPLCVFGCCNVRTWSLAVSYINIALSSLGILFSIFMVFDDVYFGQNALSVLFCTIFLILNINLRNAVLERDMAPILLWLHVYITVFIIQFLCIIAILSTLAISDMDKFVNKENFMEEFLYPAVISEVLWAFWIYSVYLYYDFEKTWLQQNHGTGHQTV